MFAFAQSNLPLGCPSTSNLVKLDPSGACVWGKQYASSFSIAVDTAGEVLVVAPYSGGPLDLGCGPIATAGSGVAVAKLSPASACVWSRAITGLGLQVGGAGQFGAAATGAGEWVVWTSYAFMKLDVAGATKWTQAFAGAPSGPGGAAFAGDPAGDVILTSCSPNFDLGGGPLLAGQPGVILAKFPP